MNTAEWDAIDSHWYHVHEGNVGWSDLLRSAGLAAAAADRACIVHKHRKTEACERENGGCLIVNPDREWAGSRFHMDRFDS